MVSLAFAYRYGFYSGVDLTKALHYFQMAQEQGLSYLDEDIASLKEEIEASETGVSLSERREVFVSWNHNDLSLMKETEAALKKEGFSVWQSDECCEGPIPESCHRGINGSDAWVILVSENTLQSEWIPQEIVWISSLIEKKPELSACLKPIWLGRSHELISERRNRGIEDSYTYLLDFAGLYDQTIDFSLLSKKLKLAISLKRIIDYRSKSNEEFSRFAAFLSNCIAAQTKSGYFSSRLKMEDAYVERELLDSEAVAYDPLSVAMTARPILILGEGGSGKSLYLQHLSWRYFKGKRYFFFLSAKAYLNYHNLHPEQGIYDCLLAEVNFLSHGGADEWTFASLFEPDENGKENTIYLLLDAIDELGDDQKGIASLFADCAALHKRYPHLHFIFTSRNEEDAALLSILGEPLVLRLSPLSDEESASLFDRIYNQFKSRSISHEALPEAQEIYGSLSELSEDIRRNPLLLSNLAIIFIERNLEKKSLPKNRYEIAEQSSEIILRDVENNRDSYCVVDKSLLSEVPNLLYDLAFRRAEGDARSCEMIFADQLKPLHRANPLEDGKALYRYLSRRAIVVGETHEANIYHALFQDYFAAKYLYSLIYESRSTPLSAELSFTKEGERLLLEEKPSLLTPASPWNEITPCLLSNLDFALYSLKKTPVASSSSGYALLSKSLVDLYAPLPTPCPSFDTLALLAEKGTLYHGEAILSILRDLKEKGGPINP